MLRVLYISFVLFFCISCEETVDPELEKDKNLEGWTNDSSTDLNKRFAFEEQMDIKVYLKRRPEMKMTETGSGLQYWIYEDKEGTTAKEGDWVAVKFSIDLLDGTTAYKSDDTDLHRFKVNKSDVESGIQEGVKFLSRGDKAKFIIPSHLGHGLVGDFNKIPPLQVLLVDIEIVSIN